MNIPSNLKYTATHEWVRQEADGSVTVGITDKGQEMLGDLVFIENPAVGRQVKQGEECVVVESVKAAADVHAPLSGVVLEVNRELEGAPEKINADAYAAWMFKLKPDDPAQLTQLLDATAYQKTASSVKT
jgi:glycine cleavage system H protein